MNKAISVRLSDMLHEHIRDKAGERGIISSEYVRSLIIQDLEYHKGLNP